MPVVDLFPLLLPLTLVIAGALVVLGFEPFLQRATKHRLLPWLAAVFLVAAGAVQLGAATGSIHGILGMDTPRLWMCAAIIVSSLLAIGGLQQSLARDDYAGGEAYSLTLFGAAGAMLMVMSADTLMLFVALELMSLSIYALVGMRRNRRESNEALFKYFIMGAVFSAIYLYGAALTYGATGSTAYGHPWRDEAHRSLFFFGQVLMLIGLLFKVGVVPFHFWTADAYTGAPVAVTGFMGAVVKVGGFASLGALWLNLGAVASGTQGAGVLNLGDAVTLNQSGKDLLAHYNLAFLVLGLLSLVLGNFSALKQTSIRRIVAFSSVSHAGYMLLALALPVGEKLQLGSLWFYLVGYALATSGSLSAFAAISGKEDVSDNLSGVAGQGRAQPFLGLVLTIFLVSIAGVPPTVGFLGKYLVFQDLVIKGDVKIAIFAMLMAVVGAAYYFRMVVTLWAAPTREATKAGSSALSTWALAGAAVLTVLLIGWPNALIHVEPNANASLGLAAPANPEPLAGAALTATVPDPAAPQSVSVAR
jgi:NADH-quinone oxidoreductase subunit N